MFEMLRNHKGKAIASSAVILAPMGVGMLLWDKLPENPAAPWNGASSQGGGGKLLLVLGIPLIFLAVHWLCLLLTGMDPKNRDQNRKAMGILFWILPIFALCLCGFFYSVALGWEWGPGRVIAGLFAVIFLQLGNYFPKLKPNYTFGIKTPWTLSDEENWRCTHRFGGKLWVAGGLLLLLALLLPESLLYPVFLVLLLAMVVPPVLYSYRFYRRRRKAGIESVKPPTTQKTWRAVSLIGMVAVLGLCGLVMFTGDIHVQVDKDQFTVQATFYQDLTVNYDQIDSLELRDFDDPGQRTNGFGSPKLSLGTFYNEEFQYYTRYTYTGVPSCIVLHCGDRILVLGGKDEAETQILYRQLVPHINPQ